MRRQHRGACGAVVGFEQELDIEQVRGVVQRRE